MAHNALEPNTSIDVEFMSLFGGLRKFDGGTTLRTRQYPSEKGFREFLTLLLEDNLFDPNDIHSVIVMYFTEPDDWREMAKDNFAMYTLKGLSGREIRVYLKGMICGFLIGHKAKLYDAIDTADRLVPSTRVNYDLPGLYRFCPYFSRFHNFVPTNDLDKLRPTSDLLQSLRSLSLPTALRGCQAQSITFNDDFRYVAKEMNLSLSFSENFAHLSSQHQFCRIFTSEFEALFFFQALSKVEFEGVLASFHDALRGDLATVTTLCKSYPFLIDERRFQATLGERLHRYISPLHVSVLKNQIRICEVLLNEGIDPNVEDLEHWTPLFYAAFCGFSDIASLLRIRGAHLNRFTPFLTSGEKIAQDCGHYQLSQQFAEWNKHDERNLWMHNVNSIDELHVLHRAVALGDISKCKELLERSETYIDQIDKYGRTALMFAARLGFKELVQLLVEHNANVFATDSSQLQPYHHALESGDKATIEFLNKFAPLNADDMSHLRHQRLYIVGDPYAGKTAFVRKLLGITESTASTDFAEVTSCEISADGSWSQCPRKNNLCVLGPRSTQNSNSEWSTSALRHSDSQAILSQLNQHPSPHTTKDNPSEILPLAQTWQTMDPRFTATSSLFLDIFDCGGQSIYVSTHQHVFSKTGLYVIVVDMTKSDAEEACDYWLQLLHEKECKPVCFLFTHADLSQNPEGAFEKTFESFNTFCVSLTEQTNDNLQVVKSFLISALTDRVTKQELLVKESRTLFEFWRYARDQKVSSMVDTAGSASSTDTIRKASEYSLIHVDDIANTSLVFGDLNVMVNMLRSVINTREHLLEYYCPSSQEKNKHEQPHFSFRKAKFLSYLGRGQLDKTLVEKRIKTILGNEGMEPRSAALFEKFLEMLFRWELAFSGTDSIVVPALMEPSPIDLPVFKEVQTVSGSVALKFLSIWQLNQILFKLHQASVEFRVHSTYQYGCVLSYNDPPPTSEDLFIHLNINCKESKRCTPLLEITITPKPNSHQQIQPYVSPRASESALKAVETVLGGLLGNSNDISSIALVPKLKLLSNPALTLSELDNNININHKNLSELHTHLLGMGSHKFWIHDIMQNFLGKYSVDVAINDGSRGSVSTILSLIFKGPQEDILQTVLNNETYFSEFYDNNSSRDLDLFSCLAAMLTADVVFSEEILLKGLFGHDLESPDCPHFAAEERLLAIEKTVSNASCGKSFRHYFRHYIVFNGRESKFQLIYGLPNGYLVAVMELDVPDPSPRALAVRAALYNCFSMLNRDGSLPKHADLNSYRGCFTPKFYPMRYALKDPLYHQKPEILTLLLNNSCRRYFIAGVSYVEFSVGVNDLLNEPIMKALSHRDQTIPITVKYLAAFPRTSVKYPVRLENLGMPATRTVISLTEVIHELLLGNLIDFAAVDKISRRDFVSSCWSGWPRWDELHSPNFVTIRDKLLERMFPKWLGEPEFLQRMSHLLSSEEGSAIVGFDLVGEEDGNPFNPFVHKSLQALLKTQREKRNQHFGIRLHCGEGVQRGSSVKEPSGGPQHRTQLNFVAHMNIMFADIQYLTPILKNERCVHDINRSCCASSLRLGHGIAFAYPVKLVLSPPAARSAVEADFPKMRRFLREHEIALELNLTSNDTLLNDLFDDPSNPFKTIEDVLTYFLEDNEIETTTPKLKVVLSTDDDGIWPIHKCPHHYRHISVASEFCRAILSGSVSSVGSITRLIEAGHASRFWHNIIDPEILNAQSTTINERSETPLPIHGMQQANAAVPFKSTLSALSNDAIMPLVPDATVHADRRSQKRIREETLLSEVDEDARSPKQHRL